MRVALIESVNKRIAGSSCHVMLTQQLTSVVTKKNCCCYDGELPEPLVEDCRARKHSSSLPPQSLGSQPFSNVEKEKTRSRRASPSRWRAHKTRCRLKLRFVHVEKISTFSAVFVLWSHRPRVFLVVACLDWRRALCLFLFLVCRRFPPPSPFSSSHIADEPNKEGCHPPLSLFFAITSLTFAFIFLSIASPF